MSVFELTEQQRNIWDWFSANSDTKTIYNSLTEEDRKVFKDSIKYQVDKEAVVRSRTNYVDIFFTLKQGQALPFSRDAILETVLLKAQQMHSGKMAEPQHESNIPAYVYSVCLTPDEQSGFSESVFDQDVEKSKRSVRRYAQLVAEWFVKLKIIAPDQKQAKEQQLFEARWKKLVETYEKADIEHTLSSSK